MGAILRTKQGLRLPAALILALLLIPTLAAPAVSRPVVAARHAAAGLVAFRSDAELRRYLRRGREENGSGAPPPPPPPPPPAMIAPSAPSPSVAPMAGYDSAAAQNVVVTGSR